jgi:hypothetical protein
MKIRRVGNDERMTTAFPLAAYGLGGSPLPVAEYRKFDEYRRYHEGNTTLIVEDDGEAVATSTAIPMWQNVRGTRYPMAGAAMGATHPLARWSGHVRALLTQLLGEMRDEGHAVSVIYPFRPSFGERFGYVGLPMPRTVTFPPAGLHALVRAELPGEVTWQRIGAGYEAYRDLTVRLSQRRHGFALPPDYHAVRLRDADEHWLVIARLDGEVVGAVTYRIDDQGGKLIAGHLLSTTALGRTLLLQFFARHVDQVTQVSTVVAADETPELWGTDFAVHSESTISFPTMHTPMARVLSVDALTGMASGPGRVGVTVVDDPFISGGYLLDGGDGRLEVRAGQNATGGMPAATLTAPGLSALVYGVLDPAELPLRGFGTVPEDAAAELRSLFPRRTPYLHAEF